MPVGRSGMQSRCGANIGRFLLATVGNTSVSDVPLSGLYRSRWTGIHRPVSSGQHDGVQNHLDLESWAFSGGPLWCLSHTCRVQQRVLHWFHGTELQQRATQERVTSSGPCDERVGQFRLPPEPREIGEEEGWVSRMTGQWTGGWRK